MSLPVVMWKPAVVPDITETCPTDPVFWGTAGVVCGSLSDGDAVAAVVGGDAA
jgi:hypothetical protein